MCCQSARYGDCGLAAGCNIACQAKCRGERERLHRMCLMRRCAYLGGLCGVVRSRRVEGVGDERRTRSARLGQDFNPDTVPQPFLPPSFPTTSHKTTLQCQGCVLKVSITCPLMVVTRIAH